MTTPTLRRSEERGIADFGWLRSHHTFSFGSYHDPRHMGIGNLRVINDDTVAPGHGFGMHGHRDMEIISYVLDGALEHRDNMGNGSVIHPGDVQLMSAGKGVQHSEFNASDEESVHFLQIWLQPHTRNVPPTYQERHFSRDERMNRLALLVSGDGQEGSLASNQHSLLYAAILDGGQPLEHTAKPEHEQYLHLARGALEVNGQRMETGDGLYTVDRRLEIQGQGEFLLFNLPTANRH